MLALRLRAVAPLVAHARRRSSRAFSRSAAWDASIKKPFLLADIGEGITECEIVKWLVTPNQVIDEFDPIVEVMSDKATVEITSPYKGRVMDLAGAVGDVLKVGGKLCEVEVEVEDGDSAVQPIAVAAPSETPASSPATAAAVLTAAGGSVLATPATRRMARESSISLSDVIGTGKDGRVTKSDVLEHLSGASHAAATPLTPPASAPAPAVATPSLSVSTSITSTSTTTLPLSPVRKAMFRAMTSTLQIPHFAYSETIDVTLLERLRLVLNASIPLAYRKTLRPTDELELERLAGWDAATRVGQSEQYDRITLLPLLIKALSGAMHSHPIFSCTLTPEQQLLRRPSHDISLALSGPTGGLYTPLLPSVDALSPYTLASKIAHLQSLAFASSPPKFPEESKRTGTITLSNVGVVGGRSTHPIIPPTGQLAIGAIGRTRVVPMYVEEDRALARGVAVSGGDASALRLEPRLLMDVTFSADHRVVEGVELARLVESWKKIIEAPGQLVGGGK